MADQNSRYLLITLLLSIMMYGIESVDFDIKVGRDARFDRFDGSCGGRKDMLIILNMDGIQVVKEKLLINGTFLVKKDITYPPNCQISIKRCKTAENLDSCEDFHTFRTDKYCQMVNSKSETWNPFFSKIEPKWSCPLRKGLYHLRKAEINISAFLLFPVDGWYWKVRGDMMDGHTKKLIMCVIVEAKVDYKKKN